MSNALKMLMRGGAAKESDPDFENTVLLLHGDGNQGATNFSNTGPTKYMAFTDNSTNNFPITVNGDAYGDNFSPFSRDEGAWSNFFDGSGDYLSIASNSALSWGTGDYTVEAWVYLTAATSRIMIVSGIGNFAFFTNSSRQVVVGRVGADELVSTGTVPLNAWTHIAATRSSNTTRIFIDGVSAATPTSITTNYGQNTTLVGSDGSNHTSGFISGFRAVKGTAVYTSAFTPSTTPLTAISGTSLLTCQSNRFKDNSSNNFAITRNGDVTVSPFTPFTVTPNTTDGSGYFDGSGDFLTAPSNAAYSFGTGDFTVECWVYSTTNQSNNAIVSNRGGASADTMWSLEFYGANNRIDWHSGTTIIMSSSSTATLNAWNHIAVSRSGTALRMYLNGVQVASVTDSRNYSAVNALQIGYEPNYVGSSSIGYLTGWVSGLRVLKGTAQYTSNFTPPTTALTAVSGTSLLTCQYQGTVRNVGFIDSSPYDHRITRVGNTTQGSFSPFSKPDGRWGNYFDGTGDYLTFTGNSSTNFSGVDWCVESWVYLTKAPSTLAPIVNSTTGTNNWAPYLGLMIRANYKLALFVNGSEYQSTETIGLNAWYHIALVRSGGVIKVYLNGVATSISITADINNSNLSFWIAYIGPPAGVTEQLGGYLSNLRMVKGSAVYTSNFTPPTAPLTAITNTSLLTCQSNRFRDNSTNAFTLTIYGDTKVTPFSPFPITTAYDPAVNGGSGYFDGSGDWLKPSNSTNATNYGTGDFTVEFWFYTNSVSSQQNVLDNLGNSSVALYIPAGGGSIRYYVGADRITGGAITPNQWYHIALVRSSGSTKLYLNGTQTGSTYADTNNYAGGSTFPFIGVSYLDTLPINGYMAGLRIVKGTAVYTTTFTPPTSPPTAVSGTSLLLNFTNAGIFDNTGFNNLETVGNAQIDTSVKKFGTGAMKFDGNGDWLLLPASPNMAMGTGDFTWEAWIYATAANDQPIYECRSTNTNTDGFTVTAFSSTVIRVFTNGVLVTATISNYLNTWTHVAFTRAGSTNRLFINGTLQNTATASDNFSNQVAVVGGGRYGSSSISASFSGYIDDLRITKGVARYTSNFTPPAKAFADIGV